MAKKKKAKKKTKKKAKRKPGGGRKSNTWELVTWAEIDVFKKATGLTDAKLAKKFGVSSVARWKIPSSAGGNAPNMKTQKKIRELIDSKTGGPTASGDRLASKKVTAESPRRVPEGISLLAMSLVERDWALARQAYDLLK